MPASSRIPARFERNLGLVGLSYFFITPLGLILLWTLLYRRGDPFPWDFLGITVLTIAPMIWLSWMVG